MPILEKFYIFAVGNSPAQLNFNFMDNNFDGKLPLFEIFIVNGDNRIPLDVPYGNLENICRSVLFHGNKVEIVSHVLKSID